MKVRPLGSTARAVTRIKDALGPDECAEVVGRSVSTVYKWCDPDGTSKPSLEQAYLLDLAFVRAGLGEPPILTAITQRLRADIDERPAEALDLVRTALSIQESTGKLANLVGQVYDTFPEEGARLTTRDLRAFGAVLTQLDVDIEGLQERLERHLVAT